MKIVNKYQIEFDQRFGSLPTSGFEDLDFSRQLFKNGCKGIYNPNLIVHHQEQPSLGSALIKSFNKGRLRNLYDNKHNVVQAPISTISINTSFVMKTLKRSLNYSFKLGYSYQQLFQKQKA